MNTPTNEAVKPTTDPLEKFRGVQAFLQSCWRTSNGNIGVDRDDVAIAIRTLQGALDDAAAPLAAQATELERERMRLVACGVVAMADTPESAAKARDMHQDYRSASCDAVARRVDECIALRKHAEVTAELVPLLKDAETVFNKFHPDRGSVAWDWAVMDRVTAMRERLEKLESGSHAHQG